MTKNTFLTVALALVTTLGGIGAPMADSKSAEGSPASESLLGTLRGRERIFFGPVVGAPGGAMIDSRCGDSEWISALNIAATGTFVDGLGVQCIDKPMLGFATNLPVVGPGAASVLPFGCPTPGAVPTGIYGRAGSVVDRIGLVCRGYRDALDRGELGGDWGGTGGSTFINECPRGYWLVGLRIWSGLYISAVQPICRYDP